MISTLQADEIEKQAPLGETTSEDKVVNLYLVLLGLDEKKNGTADGRLRDKGTERGLEMSA